MSYIVFKFDELVCAIQNNGLFKLEPTQINKVNVVKRRVKFLSGEINFRNTTIPVYDFSKLLHKKSLKKFDGVCFVTTPKQTVGFTFNGFFQIVEDVRNVEMVNLKKVFKLLKLK